MWREFEHGLEDESPENGRCSPLVAELQELFVEPVYHEMMSFQERMEQTCLVLGNNNAVRKAILAAEREALRVRGVIESMDGVCLDNREDRERLIHAIYGTGSTDNK